MTQTRKFVSNQTGRFDVVVIINYSDVLDSERNVAVRSLSSADSEKLSGISSIACVPSFFFFRLFPLFISTKTIVNSPFSFRKKKFPDWAYKKGRFSGTEFEKTIVFIVVFLENSENFLNFDKSSKKFGEFLNCLAFSKIF